MSNHVIFCCPIRKRILIEVKYAVAMATSGQEPHPQENGDASPEAESAPRKCDTIAISGREEKCELARQALLVWTTSPTIHLYPQELLHS